MRDKIFEEAMEWYKQQGDKPDVFIEDFVDLVIDKTAENIFDKLKDELKQEFENGNLQHPFIISSDYYLELKLKEIKQKYVKSLKKEEVAEE